MRFPWSKAPVPPGPDMAEMTEIVRREVHEAASTAAREATAEIAGEVARALVPLAGSYAPPTSGVHDLYAWNNPYNFTVPQPPYKRPESQVSLDLLRRVADTYDVARSCIQHLKREVASVPLRIGPKDAKDQSEATKARVKAAEAFFDADGGLGGQGKHRAAFEAELLEDLLVIGAGSAYYRPTRGGGIHEVTAIDALTIQPLVDAFGWPPETADGAPPKVYAQWVMGIKVAEFSRNELYFGGLSINARSYSPYPASPLEWLIATILTAMKADEWNRVWLTDGNTPSDMLALPQEWNPDQIKTWSAFWDQLMAGDSAQRQKTRFVPGGSQKVGSSTRKENDFQEFMLWLLRRTCSGYGVAPASIGYAGEQYKVSQEGSMDSTTDFGVGVLLDWRKTFYDDLLRRMGYADLEAQNVTDREDDAKTRAETNEIRIRSGVKTINEARAEEGMDPIEGGENPLVSNTLVPLDQLLNPPEPADTGTGGGPVGETDDDPNGETE